jgi:hypothetical protein
MTTPTQAPAAGCRQYVTLKQALEARPWLTERWLRRKIEQRRIPYAKADGKILLSLVDIDMFVEASRVEPTA